MSKPLVSVWCLAYNHEKYIRQALESFVTQKTDFPYEVLINDDASKDHTREIIQEYADRYPDIIKPVFQVENQYSQDVHILTQILLPKSEGKYFAICEGDDYWTDPYKLQKQVDYMQAHPECSMCIHNSTYVTESGEFLEDHIVSSVERDISTEEVILGGGGFCCTNSIFAPVSLAKNLLKCFYVLKMDYAWQTCLASMGTTHCLAESMSAYRVCSIGSWSSQNEQGDPVKLASNAQNIIRYLDEFDADKSAISRNGDQTAELPSFDDSIMYKEQRYFERCTLCWDIQVHQPAKKNTGKSQSTLPVSLQNCKKASS